MSSNGTRFALFEVDAHGAGRAGGTYTSISTAERAAIIRARQLAEKADSTVTAILICDGDGATVARVAVTAMREVAA